MIMESNDCYRIDQLQPNLAKTKTYVSHSRMMKQNVS